MFLDSHCSIEFATSYKTKEISLIRHDLSKAYPIFRIFILSFVCWDRMAHTQEIVTPNEVIPRTRMGSKKRIVRKYFAMERKRERVECRALTTLRESAAIMCSVYILVFEQNIDKYSEKYQSYYIFHSFYFSCNGCE